MNCAPIALFCYNRPDHLAATLAALEENSLYLESPLYVFSDGARSRSDVAHVRQVRRMIEDLSKTRLVTAVLSDENRGLAASILDGIEYVFQAHDRVIVLEDDIIASPGFLSYMNTALDRYREETRIAHISGYREPVSTLGTRSFLFQVTSCWGWGTWRDRWRTILQTNPAKLLSELKRRRELWRFDLDGSGVFLPQLAANISGEIRTWAVLWYASCYLNRRKALHPPTTLTKNIGFDGTGEHCNSNTHYTNQDLDIPQSIDVEIDEFTEDSYRERVKDFYRTIRKTRSSRLRVFGDPLERRIVHYTFRYPSLARVIRKVKRKWLT